MRTTDRERAKLRKERQHGETEEQFETRIKLDLESETGYRIRILRDKARRYEVYAYADNGSLTIRAVNASLTAAAKRVRIDAELLANAGVKP